MSQKMYLWLIWENNISIIYYNQRNEELASNQLKNASHLTILKFTTQNEIKLLYNILNKCVITTCFSVTPGKWRSKKPETKPIPSGLEPVRRHSHR
jgi:hypothetical protein